MNRVSGSVGLKVIELHIVVPFILSRETGYWIAQTNHTGVHTIVEHEQTYYILTDQELGS